MVWLIKNRDGTLERSEVSVDENNSRQIYESTEKVSQGAQNKQSTKGNIEEQELNKAASTAKESNEDKKFMENILENMTPNVGHFGDDSDDEVREKSPGDILLLIGNFAIIANAIARVIWFTERGISTKGWYYYIMAVNVTFLIIGAVLFTYGTYKLGLWWCCGQKKNKDDNALRFLNLACFLMFGYFFSYLFATIITSVISWSKGYFDFAEFMTNIIWTLGNAIFFLFYIPNTIMVKNGYPTDTFEEWKSSLKLIWKDMLDLLWSWINNTKEAPKKMVEEAIQVKDEIKERV